jgi:hypothetical protein
MEDEWTKKLPGGRTVAYTSNIEDGTGGVISAHVGDIALTQHVYAPMTRQEVEALFAPTVGG